ncbi:efflux RND transporter periplasmic adaptor subunit [Carboxylicivirga caseinilyticus]|uniref:efflux RND transporter periplasmic adaptor subunit n=1 Tax=Carboxylicivirga caseinilyticus TaxID=3417572 RepID=UPI003D32C858|nr:efflux RND transporter periplasmic adaptor subunit [Marinilabiliaceae bacterium A049]
MKNNRNQIMKKFVFILSVLFLASCAATTEDARKEKEEALATYKSEFSELKQKIAKLEKELAEDTGEGVISVVTTEIQPILFEHFVDVSGQVQADKNIVVSPESSGKIVSIDVKEGQRVQKGQVLARLNTEMIQRSLDEININLDLAKTTFERQSNLWEQNIGSEMEYLQAKSQMESLKQKKEALEAQVDMAVVRAPINGIVDEIIQRQGEMASPAAPFVRLVNIDQVYINADVSEIYLQKIKAGDKVKVNFPVLDKTIEGEIYRTSSVIDRDSRTFRLRVNLNNPENDYKPNMLAVLKLKTYSAENSIVVPSILVKKDFSGEFVFIASQDEGKSIAKKQYIKTGIKDNNNTLVTEGLSKGDQLITTGYAQVVDGSAISL